MATRARTNLDALFRAALSDRERYALLWPLKRYAGMGGDQAASSLYMSASRESERGSHEHISRTVQGLVAAARGDVPGAELWLLESAACVEVGTKPAVTLAEALLRTGRRETVLRYVEACERVVGAESSSLVELRSRLVAMMPTPG